jgi:hypothetical protein
LVAAEEVEEVEEVEEAVEAVEAVVAEEEIGRERGIVYTRRTAARSA